ncbi:MAG: bifunctional folylpolyglutamate synthase/dihydrofolate synthase [Candidatus Nanopelagicus sp.]|nr:bifunctional folylpolyglutamate synthase/dihydrofolate synthase [Candidatus Nanopelagicus sp.]
MKDKENLVRLNEIAAALNKRWPENQIEPSLDRILALVDALGSPHLTYPTIHIAGTNGKTSTARMIDQLLANLGYRVGRYTSPHLESFTERISIKGEPISDLEMIKTYEDIHLYLDLIDSRQPHPISYFEALTAMAFVAFAEHPVDIAVIEAGMGGQWDATNVISSQVSVMTPIGLDHMEYLGNTVEAIAQTKAGIFKPESNVVLAAQSAQVAKVLLAQVAKVSAQPFRQGVEFSLKNRALAVGGQLLSIQGVHGDYDEIFLPLYGDHQGNNAAIALAAVEVFAGVKLDTELVQDAFSKVSSPGRCEIVYKDPTVIIDAAHNPHGVSAIANTLNTEFDFELVVGVVAVLADKDVAGILKNLATTLDYLVITENGSNRAMNKDELAKIASQYFKAEQVEIIGDMNSAITYAIEKVALFNQVNDGVAAVVITGSVATAGMARSIIKGLARVK